MDVLKSEIRIPSGHIEVFPLRERDKEKKRIRKEFQRAATQLAKTLATLGNGKRRAKNNLLANILAVKLCDMPFDVFSRLDPERKHAFEAKNLVFRIRKTDEESLNGRKFSAAVFVRKPQRRVVLPWCDEKARHVIPLTVELPVPLTAQNIAEAGRSVRKIAEAFSTPVNRKASSRRRLADEESMAQLGDLRLHASRRRHVEDRTKERYRRANRLQIHRA